MRKLIAMLVLMGTGQFALSQVTIFGIVQDSASHKPLPNTLITLGNNSLIANEKGEFSIPDLP